MNGSLAALADPFNRKPIRIGDMSFPYRRCGYPHIGKTKGVPAFPAMEVHMLVEMAVFIATTFTTGEFHHPVRAEDPVDQPLILETNEGPIDGDPIVIPF